MLSSVPRRTGSWSGTGTVVVVVSKRFCMIRWLPRWRTAANPFCSRIRQTSEPERTRSLPNRNLNLSHEDFVAKTPGDFRRVGHFEEKRKRLDEVRTRFFNGRTVARNIELGAQRHKSIVLTLDNRGYALCWPHDPSLPQFHLAVAPCAPYFGVRSGSMALSIWRSWPLRKSAGVLST